MQFPRRAAPPKKPNQFIFDADMGNRVDTVLALGLVYGHAVRDESEADVPSVGTSKANLSSAVLYDVMRRFYERPTLPGAGGASSVTYEKVGYRMDGNTPDSTPILDAVVPAFPHEVNQISDVKDSVAGLRDTITELPDGGGVIIAAGPLTTLARLLPLVKMKETLTEKVRLLVIAAGRFPSGSDAAHIAADVAAAKLVFEEWPTPIVVCGAEVGDQIKFPASSIESDFAWAENHPVVAAYRAAGTMPYDAAAWETAAALYAVQPDAGYFGLSAPGRVSIADDGAVSFAAAADGNQRHLTLDASKHQQIVDAITDLVSTQPMPAATATPPPDPEV